MPTATEEADVDVDYASMEPKQLRGLYTKGIRNDHTRRAVADYAREKKAERAAASKTSDGGEDIATHSANDGDTAADEAGVGRGQTIRTPRPATSPRDLTPPEHPKPAPPATVPMTPSTGAVRRLRALALIGITPARIAELTGIPVDSIWWLMMRPPTSVATPIHARIADTFRQLRVSPVTPNPHTSDGRMAARAIALAEALEWAGPFDWDDIDGRCDSCYTRAQGTHTPRPVVKITRTGRAVDLVRYTRTRDGIRHDLITGILLHTTATHWVVSVGDELLELPRDEWLEALAA